MSAVPGEPWGQAGYGVRFDWGPAGAARVGAADGVLFRRCASGVELVTAGFAEDVEVAVELDASEVVPRLLDGAFRA